MPHGILTAQKSVNSVSALFQHRDCVQSCSKQLKNQQILFLVCCDWGFDANISASAIIILDSLWRIETQIQSCKQCSWLIYRSDAETRTNCNVQRLTNFCQGCSCHCENPCNLFRRCYFWFRCVAVSSSNRDGQTNSHKYNRWQHQKALLVWWKVESDEAKRTVPTGSPLSQLQCVTMLLSLTAKHFNQLQHK